MIHEMEASKLSRAKALLYEAQALPPDQRIHWLTQQCAGEQDLLEELVQLVQFTGQQNDLLDRVLPETLGSDSAPAKPLAPDTLLGGRYRIISLLAQGGFATVYLAQDERLANRDVVVKVLDRVHLAVAGNNAAKEIQALAAISSPDVVGILDCGALESSNLPFLVTRYVKGRTLRAILQDGLIPLNTGMEIIRKAANALAAAHQEGVLHLDLKPENIMVSFEDPASPDVTIIDFGISILYLSATPASPSIAGSTRYMAPEQSQGRPSYSSDLFSLGIVACEVLTGQTTTAPATAARLLAAKGVPAPAVSAITSALSPQPESRIASAKHFARACVTSRPQNPWLWLAVSAASIAVASLAFLALQPSQSSRLTLGQAFPVTHELGYESFPSFSPDGRRIYYTRGRETISGDLYYTDLGSNKSIRLTDHPADDRLATCSRDGSRIAFLRTYREADQGIIIMPALGGQEQEITRAAGLFNLEWSGDGNALLVATAGEKGQRTALKILDLQSRQWRNFLDPPADSQGDVEPALSPDATKVVFVRRFNSSSNDLFLVSVDKNLLPTAEPRRITFTQGRKRSPRFTPDGREIVFGSDVIGATSTWRMPVGGGEASRIEGIPLQAGNLAIPKDVWKIAYTMDLTDSNLWRLDLSTPEGPVLGKQQIASSSFDDEEVRISPDGKRILFTSSRTGVEQIWTANTDGSDVRQVTAFPTADTISAHWMPDGKSLIVGLNAKPEGRRSFFLSLADGRQTPFLSRGFAVGVSRDGSRILVRSPQTGQDEIWSYDLQGGNPQQLTRIGARQVRDGMDGKTLYVAKQDRREGLWAVSPGGQATRYIPDLAVTTSFAVHSEGIYHMRMGPPATVQLRRFRDGKDILLYTLDKRPFWGFDVSADGKTIFFSQTDIENQDIMVINDFR